MMGVGALGELALGEKPHAITQAIVAETNVHFLAKFRPAVLNVPQLLRYCPDIEPPVAETNVHFIARFTPAILNVPQLLRQFYPDIEPPVAETNVHFVGSFAPARYTLLRALWQHYDLEIEQEANPHFLGRFRPISYNWFALNAGWFSSLFHITDTTILQLPINCILMGQQDYELGDSEIEARDPNIRTRTTVSDGGSGRLSDNASSFSVKTGNKGYD